MRGISYDGRMAQLTKTMTSRKQNFKIIANLYKNKIRAIGTYIYIFKLILQLKAVHEMKKTNTIYLCGVNLAVLG
jgi:hypothetical protein